MQVANVNIVGNIGGAPESRQTPNGLAVLNFSVAVNSKRGTEETTAWYRCAVFGKTADTLAPLLASGQTVYVAGRLTPREYEHNGERRQSLDVAAQDVVILTGRDKAGEDDDAIPF